MADPTLHALSKNGDGSVPGFEKLRSFMDSGAARSVCSKDFGSWLGTTTAPEGRHKDGFQTADGTKVPNLGSRTVQGLTETGSSFGMKYCVADINVTLDSVSQICDGDSTVTFTRTGGWIERGNGERSYFIREGDTYIREVWVTSNGGEKVESLPFSRQTRS